MKKDDVIFEEMQDEELFNPAMEKDEIVDRLRKGGHRITSQRLLLLDVILESDNQCCKEIYFKLRKKNLKVGIATIYRMMNTLEEIGAIHRENTFRLCSPGRIAVSNCIIEFSSGKQICLSEENFYKVVENGIRHQGMKTEEKIQKIMALNQPV